MSKPICGTSSKTTPYASPFQVSLVNISRLNQDHCLKYDVDILVIKLLFISHHLPNDSPIPPESVSFRFGWMNYETFDTALVSGPQGHCLGVEPYFPHHYYITLLSLRCKFPMFGNGGVTLDEALLNFSVATKFWLPHICHFHTLVEIDQVTTL
jgi:hypothetical protein